MAVSAHLRLLYRAWRYRLRIDPGEIHHLLATLRPGQRALDIGAHKGAYSYWMSKAVGSEGEVFAFEPQPELAAYLAGLALPNLTVENLALSSAAGEGMLNIPGSGPSPGATLETRRGASGRQMAVRRTTLDSYFAARSGPPVSLIKCDVEGHELAVLQGGAELLARDRPALILECEARHHAGDSIADVFAWLDRLGYRGSFFLRGSRLPLEQFDAVKHQRPGHKPYVNNFIFEHEDGHPGANDES